MPDRPVQLAFGWATKGVAAEVAPAPDPAAPATIASATLLEGTGRKRGPVPKRRFQKGSFQVQNGKAYTLFYEDVDGPCGATTTQRVRHLIGDLSSMSERAARREHDLFMAEVNRRRGSVSVPVKGETFQDAVNAWKKDVAPQLSPATVRQRESYLRIHVLPVFGKEGPQALDVPALQRFATTLQNNLSPKTVINILETVFAVLRYAKKCGTRTSPVSFSDLTIRDRESPERPFFTMEQVAQIICAAKEPYKTMFALASVMGARAGELMALTVPDLDFGQKTVRVNKSADDLTREVRQPKTRKSVALLPMPSCLETMLRDYLKHHWNENPNQLLFVLHRRPTEGPQFAERTQTIVVNAHGALMSLVEKVAPEQRLFIQNTNSGEQKECHVVYMKKELGGPTRIAVEFTRPAPTFWRIAYPPADWAE